jgi:hypothetical protein
VFVAVEMCQAGKVEGIDIVKSTENLRTRIKGPNLSRVSNAVVNDATMDRTLIVKDYKTCPEY